MAKLFHAMTTYVEIVEYEKIIGKYNDIDFIPTQLMDSPKKKSNDDLDASTEALLKR